MAARYEGKASMVTPGPGTYKKRGFIENSNKMTVPKGERGNALIVKEQLLTPPPGNYLIRSRISSQGVAINPPKQEINERASGNPGPGTYSPKIGLKEK